MRHLLRGEFPLHRGERDRPAGLHPLAKLRQHPAEQIDRARLRRELHARNQLRLAQEHADEPFFGRGRAQVVVVDGADLRRALARDVELLRLAFALFDGAGLAVGLFDLQLHGLGRDAGGLSRAAAVDLALYRVRERGDERGGLREKFHALLVERQVEFAPETVEPVFGLVLAAVKQDLKALRAVFFQKFVRVLRPLHPQDAHLDAGLFEHRDGAARGVLPGLVAVVGQDDLIGVLGEDVRVLLRQRRAERGHGAVEPVLVQGDGVHIALGEDDAALLALAGDVEREEIFAFVEDERLRRVEVFGRRIVHHAAAEADDVPPDVDDGEHEAVAEAVVHAAVFAPDGEPGVDELVEPVALFLHGVRERRPRVRAEAKAEALDRVHAERPLLYVRLRGLAHGGKQLLAEKPRRVLAQGPKALLLLILRVVGLVLRYLHPRALGEEADGVGEVQPLDLHDEVDHAAARVAAEAVIDALVRGDGERSGLLRVERAEAEEVRAPARQAHILSHDLVDGVAVDERVKKRLWKCQGRNLLSQMGSSGAYRTCHVVGMKSSEYL